jgi:hypothetical protein
MYKMYASNPKYRDVNRSLTPGVPTIPHQIPAANPSIELPHRKPVSNLRIKNPDRHFPHWHLFLYGPFHGAVILKILYPTNLID